tara:strand:+ start:1194 stop:2927 length:1734 start_codon:yes stop_codon:yes gene_type:complete
MKIKSYIHKIRVVLGKKNQKQFCFLIIGLFFLSLLELIGLGSIPFFIVALFDPENFLTFLNNLNYLNFLIDFFSENFILKYSFLIISIFFIKNIYYFYIILVKSRFIKKVKIDLIDKLYNSYINKEYIFHVNNNPSKLVKNLNTEINRTVSSVSSLLSIFLEILLTFLIFLVIFLSNPVISISAVIFLSLISLVYYFVIKEYSVKWGKNISKYFGIFFKNLSETFGAIREIKLSNKLENYKNIVMKNVNEMEQMNLNQTILNSTPRIILEVIAVSSIVLIAMIMIYFDENNNSNLALLSFVAISSIRLVPSITTISKSFNDMNYLNSSLDIIYNDITNKTNADLYYVDRKEKKLNFKNKLSIQNLSFGYDKSNVILNNINLKIDKGSKVSISGQSGSGKTTLVNLITGLLKPDKGKILIDDLDIINDLSTFQSKIGYVAQDTYLLDDTIRENLTFLVNDKTTVSEHEIWDILKLVKLDKFLDTCQNGLDTIIGDRAVRVSGGQKQRISLARTLLIKPEILILDEATSALDFENEELILDEIMKLYANKTIILITHRKNSLKYCDKNYSLIERKLTRS